MQEHHSKHPIGRNPKLHRLTCIWDESPHNALTDLIFFKNHFVCCFRESDKHAGSKNGKIRILISKDAQIWEPISLIEQTDIDLRDPTLSITPEGKLMLLMGGAQYEKDKCISFNPFVAFSDNGSSWNLSKIDMTSEWIWRVTWHQGVGYAASYFLTDPSDAMQPWILKLFSTKDGKSYSLIRELDVSKHPSETTLRFASDGTMIALVRRRGNALFGVSPFPYLDWNWFSLKRRIGGPNFLILPGGEMWSCTRILKPRRRCPRTALSLMSAHALKPKLILPSGGDTSYPGMIYLGDRLYISYYSSHEGKAKIYLAEIGK